ncbi:hypothetical protein FVEN_g8080 [Fusarium venenatum]|uniref:Apple domain-containing protein n=1 Tax=Fusarium venenatum TaxID=56646 RepID=A0A2L2T569_9HYPO|nr:uncharacterized protein FVRRES_04567 [Fusarium venenatum]KAG8353971.1 hypothetical protein FVEN_g8080 [Fusarium venenatum]KAH6991728.1 hypothetical protein EDB82DRAFT_534941 [Fusarium venenatum]CEI60131.1 unnamed protein product [Fusarium venenatum]
MARHFVRSFVIAAALSPFVNAGPCRPSSSSVAVITTTAETSVKTGSATTHTEESSLTQSLSGTSIKTSLTISESESNTESLSATSTETTFATSKIETGSTSVEQSTTTGSALSTDLTTTASESDSSTGTTLDNTTSTECPDPEPPVYDDPFTATNTGEFPVDTTEAATTTADAAPTIIPRNFVRRGHPEIVVRDVTSGEPAMTTEEAATTTETTATTSEDATTSGDATTTGDTTSTSEDTTATTEGATTTTEEATTTASETATGCINNMEKPSPEGAICGARGYIYGTTNDWRYLGQGSSSSLLDCYTSCQEKSNCVTFTFEKDSQCYLYSGTITELSSDRTTTRNYETRCFCDTGIEPAPTCSYDTSIVNGGFDNGKFSPWQEDPNPGGKVPVALRPVQGGEGGTDYRLQTGQFDFDKSMWIYQDVKACPGTRFYCSYRWRWEEYYAILQRDGSSLVPYIRVYQDDYRIGNRYPTGPDQTKTWINANFQFTVPESGETRIWFIASSPQGEWINNSDDPCTPDWVHRPNSFALDSVYCSS